MGYGRQSKGLWAGWLVFVGLIFLPSVWYFFAALFGGNEEAATRKTGATLFGLRTAALLGRSLVLGAGASALALIFGTATGYLTTRAAFPGRRLFFAALLLPFFLPGYVHATAWIEWMTRGTPAANAAISPAAVYSVEAAIVVLGLYLFPWVHLAAGAGFASIESHLDDAGRLALGDWARFARVLLPLVTGALAACGLFIFVIGLKSHSVPMLLRQRVFATEIMIAYEALGDERGAAQLALICGGVSLAALAVALWVIRRRRRIAIEGISSPWRKQPGKMSAGGMGAMAIAAAALTVTVVLPLATLVRTAGAWTNYVVVWRSAWPQMVNGLTAASATATVSVVLGFVLAEHILRSSRMPAAFTVASLFLLFALPAPVLDLGLIRFWNRPGPMGWVYDSRMMLVLGQTAAFLPVAVLGLWVALRRIDPRLIETAEIAGLPWRTIAQRILWPMLRAWLVGVWAVVFVLSLNDAETAVLLAPAGQATLSVRIMTLLHYAPDAQVSALCVIQVIVTAAAIGLVAAGAVTWVRLARRRILRSDRQ
jgi:iron(III) transport system permease protein